MDRWMGQTFKDEVSLAGVDTYGRAPNEPCKHQTIVPIT